MKRRTFIMTCMLCFGLAVGLSACGKKATPANVNGNGNANVNATGNANQNTNSASNANASVTNGNANGNANTNANPALLDPNADPDKDSLTNAQELKYHTDPLNPDTDNDGYPDGEEVATGYDPLLPPDKDPKVLEQLQSIPTTNTPVAVRSTPFRAAQSFSFTAVKGQGTTTIPLVSNIALASVNYGVSFTRGQDTSGPMLALDVSFQLLNGTYASGKVWLAGQDFTRGKHYFSTSNLTGVMTVYPPPTPPFSIDGFVDDSIGAIHATNQNQFIVDFPTSTNYSFALGVSKGKVMLSIDNLDLVLNGKVAKSFEAITNQTMTADISEGLHTLTITDEGLATWTLRVIKS